MSSTLGETLRTCDYAQDRRRDHPRFVQFCFVRPVFRGGGAGGSVPGPSPPPPPPAPRIAPCFPVPRARSAASISPSNRFPSSPPRGTLPPSPTPPPPTPPTTT